MSRYKFFVKLNEDGTINSILKVVEYLAQPQQDRMEISEEDFNKIKEFPERWQWNSTTKQFERRIEYIEKFKQDILNTLKEKVKQLLANTDYVLLKAYEHQLLGFSNKVNEIKQQYATTLQRRQQIRVWNNQKEIEIQNATTYEELDAILVEIEQYEGQ